MPICGTEARRPGRPSPGTSIRAIGFDLIVDGVSLISFATAINSLAKLPAYTTA